MFIKFPILSLTSLYSGETEGANLPENLCSCAGSFKNKIRREHNEFSRGLWFSIYNMDRNLQKLKKF